MVNIGHLVVQAKPVNMSSARKVLPSRDFDNNGNFYEKKMYNKGKSWLDPEQKKENILH